MKKSVWIKAGILSMTVWMMTACGEAAPTQSEIAQSQINADETGETQESETETEETESIETGETEVYIGETDTSGTLKSDAQRAFEELDWDMVKKNALDHEKIEDGIDDDMNDGYAIYRIAQIPDEQITLYGYVEEDNGDMAVAIDDGENTNYFSWYFMGVHQRLPDVYYDKANDRLQIALHLYTGTGFSGDEIVVLNRYETGTLAGKCLTYEDFGPMLKRIFSYQYDEEKGKLTITDRETKEEVVSMVIPKEYREKKVQSVQFGEITRVELGEQMRFYVTPGYVMDEVPFYDEMPEIALDLDVEGDGEKITFAFGDWSVEE